MMKVDRMPAKTNLDVNLRWWKNSLYIFKIKVGGVNDDAQSWRKN